MDFNTLSNDAKTPNPILLTPTSLSAAIPLGDIPDIPARAINSQAAKHTPDWQGAVPCSRCTYVNESAEFHVSEEGNGSHSLNLRSVTFTSHYLVLSVIRLRACHFSRPDIHMLPRKLADTAMEGQESSKMSPLTAINLVSASTAGVDPNPWSQATDRSRPARLPPSINLYCRPCNLSGTSKQQASHRCSGCDGGCPILSRLTLRLVPCGHIDGCSFS